ncbi:hypothetical protein M0804_004691 [Polistes exclamans]|nr:hypothetical protein M0804_004691 [Polistes exclamans]
MVEKLEKSSIISGLFGGTLTSEGVTEPMPHGCSLEVHVEQVDIEEPISIPSVDKSPRTLRCLKCDNLHFGPQKHLDPVPAEQIDEGRT